MSAMLYSLSLTPAALAGVMPLRLLRCFTKLHQTELIDTSRTREIDRMDEPSHIMERIWTRLAVESLCTLLYVNPNA